jgi:hypothetical protein
MGYHGDKLFDVGNLTKYIMWEKHAMFFELRDAKPKPTANW